MNLGRLRDALEDAAGRDVWLVPALLPEGVAAVWTGGASSEQIAYPQESSLPADAVAHALGHVALLHCGGHAHNGGRFACVDTRDCERADTRYRLHAFFGEDEDELPGSLFTARDEQEADKVAGVILNQCGHDGQILPVPRVHQAFRCLG